MKFQCPTKTLQELCSFVGAFAEECLIRLDERNLLITQVDPSHIAMVILTLPRSKLRRSEAKMEDYLDRNKALVKEDRKHLDTDAMAELLKHLAYDSVCLEWEPFDEGATHSRVTISAKDDESEFKCSWLEEHSVAFPVPSIPKIKMPYKLTVNPGTLYRFLQAHSGSADHIRVRTDGNKRTIIRIEGDNRESELSLKGKMVTQETTPLSVYFPRDYIENAIRAIRNCPSATIDMGTDVPCSIKGTAPSGIEFEFMLAPRIEAD
jgi:DNA polymerase III sliding clamp (beta) subunit (PCNA family)